ncbi:T9SS type A sorting domain-containing protein [Lutibacter citreus]|uniref:T9SS type A sorting domain-containing protein n=1 Tax=Lutibacter citreus TaxID=2138210 RepID=UPI000DBE215A|nr:T9SS type A sorting domain-containing protein [Lutibacter citreus]
MFIKTIHFLRLLVLMLFLFFETVNAQYTETIDLNGLKVNAKDDFNLVDDNAEIQQADNVNAAIDFVEAQGGGIVYIPKGIYCFNNILMKSNVHVIIESGTIIRPKIDTGIVFTFFHIELNSKGREVLSDKFIENVSLRADGGTFTVDLYDQKIGDKQRVIIAKMVKNFLIQDMVIKDNNTTYSAMTFTPIKTNTTEEVEGWEVTRPTNGTLRNITHYRVSPDYALVQCHGAQSIHFEDLYANGGVALRLEVGANNINVGVYDITAKNIICENGKATLLMGPHSAKNGVVTVDGVTSIGCSRAVSFGDGHVKEDSPIRTSGYFSSDSSIKNIHAINGNKAQFKWGTDVLSFTESDFENLKTLEGTKHFTGGPTVGIVLNQAKSYTVNIDESTITRSCISNEIPSIRPPSELTEAEEKVLSKQAAVKKEEWVLNHTGPEWISDIGTHNLDYEVEAYDFSKVIEKEEIENDNFSIKVVGETCPNQNNGKIEIKAKLENDYKIYLNDIEYKFTDEIVFENLETDTYEFCISIPNKCFERCFKVEVEKAEPISGKIAVKSNKAAISVNKGTPPYSVLINGNLVLNTSLSNFEIDVNAGDRLEVASNKECEGIFSKNIDVNNKIIVFPNPSSETILLSFNERNKPYIIYDLFGKIVDKGVYKNKAINIAGLNPGVYIIQVNNMNNKFVKI